MDKELVAYLRSLAHDLVALARKSTDATIAGELEAMAIELLERARIFENHARF